MFICAVNYIIDVFFTIRLLFFIFTSKNEYMALLNLGFVILLIKITICVLPGALGIFLYVANEDTKRDLRNVICSKLFGVRNAIPYPSFARALLILGTLLLIFSLVSIWFLLLRNYFISDEELRSQISYSIHLSYLCSHLFY